MAKESIDFLSTLEGGQNLHTLIREIREENKHRQAVESQILKHLNTILANQEKHERNQNQINSVISSPAFRHGWT